MTNGNGRTVLVVEDDHSVRKLLSGYLEMLGCRVLPAAGGAEAIAAAEAFPGEIHLVVTDFGLGEMNGLEMAARIAGRRPGIGILLISGYSEIPLPPGLKDAVRPEFLAKPFTMEEFLGKAGRMMGPPAQAPGT